MISLPYVESNQTDSLLREILASSQDAIVAEADGKVVAINARFLELVGWCQPYAGQSLDELTTDWVAQATDPGALEAYFRLCRSGDVGSSPRELQPQPGRVIEARCVETTGAQGQTLRLWLFQEWRTSALAWVGHEIKNPLNAVLGFSDLLSDALSGAPASEEVKTSLRGLRIGTKHLQSVLGDLLDLSRLESGLVEVHPDWVDIGQFLGDVEALHRTRFLRKGLDFVVDAPQGNNWEIWVDQDRLSQILGNLLSNARRFTKRGRVAVRVHHEKNSWRFIVEDSGLGIPIEEQKAIFEPFVQKQGQASRQFGGTGLGLAICRTLASALGAELELESEPGRGSCFTLRFDHMKCRPGIAPARAPSEPGNIPLLVVEDEKTNRLLIQGFLRDTPFSITEAPDGSTALGLWNSLRPRVALIDLRMPGLSGLETARRIRALDPDHSTVLIAMSATKPSDVETAEGEGLWADFLEKPFRKQEILKILSKHLTIVDELLTSRPSRPKIWRKRRSL